MLVTSGMRPKPAMQYSWMEEGEVGSYQEVDKIDIIRVENAQRYTSQSQYNSYILANSKKIAKKSTKSMPCPYFSQGSCVHQNSHDVKGTLQ